MFEALKNTFGVVGAMVFSFAAPVTYILNVVDTWQGDSAVWLKLLINLTMDAVLAAIWPITWILWIVMELTGSSTPLSRVLGF
ncbi:hypothetical protein [Mesorhizobium australicum]|uniref:Uncharacterized protein n=1 Tax=Mesorhizobium australicum TaxID=536018 RepID=A0A1X7NEB7_9HYPH|nr:hypothetical protein [Mesorhizobium australicum]SMH36040.1 hypothetical protein SAMN02982922_1679 [Mesorhizobium australicum]